MRAFDQTFYLETFEKLLSVDSTTGWYEDIQALTCSMLDELGYSYEIYTSAISAKNGSHELFVGYQTELNLYKKGRNLHKTVRLL